jgi:hypothetical protein
MNWIIGGFAIAFLMVGLIGQGFEMRKIKQSIRRDEDLSSENVFKDKRNFKWYAMIGIGIILWFIAQSSTQYSI